MKYRVNPKNGDELSILGFGCMRFPKDEKEVEKEIVYAIENGVNYFDTAYVYQGSEVTLGRVLAKNGYRNRVKIATKMPNFLIKRYEDLDKIFNKQLERLQTDYVDYYFMHMLSDVNIWNRLIDLGILKWIEEKKQKKQIFNIGFSYHGGKSEFKRLIDAFNWDFCMIQYNFLDENNQAGKSGLEYAASKGMPVMIMEPLRGGMLVNGLPKEVYDIWKNSFFKRSPAEWALRFVWNHPEVTLLLSGMNSMEMITENINTASDAEADSFTQEEYELFDKVREVLKKKIAIPCSGCNYCMPCPNGVDIPTCFSCYNDREREGKMKAFTKYLMQTTLKSDSLNASHCIKCGVCETRCPQKLEIRSNLAQVTRKMEGFYYKPLRFVIKKFMRL